KSASAQTSDNTGADLLRSSKCFFDVRKNLVAPRVPSVTIVCPLSTLNELEGILPCVGAARDTVCEWSIGCTLEPSRHSRQSVLGLCGGSMSSQRLPACQSLRMRMARLSAAALVTIGFTL